jgi:hypothetical protein
MHTKRFAKLLSKPFVTHMSNTRSASRFYPPIGEFLRRFSTVVSLNYDLIVYWAILVSNNKLGTWFKDCFVNGQFDHDWERFRDSWE